MRPCMCILTSKDGGREGSCSNRLELGEAGVAGVRLRTLETPCTCFPAPTPGCCRRKTGRSRALRAPLPLSTMPVPSQGVFAVRPLSARHGSRPWESRSCRVPDAAQRIREQLEPGNRKGPPLSLSPLPRPLQLQILLQLVLPWQGEPELSEEFL